MGEAQGLKGILLHHGDGHAVRVDGRDGLEELLGGPRRQSCRRLVEEEHRRLDHQRHGHGQDLALPARERARGLPPLLGEHGKAGEDRVHPGPAVCGIEIPAHLEVLANAHAREDILLLRHQGQAEGGDGARRPAADGLTAKPHRPLVRHENARDDLEQGGFARAVRADDADDLTGVEGEVHALEDHVGGAVAGHDSFRGQEAHWRSPM
jgi:hypothetical protein